MRTWYGRSANAVDGGVAVVAAAAAPPPQQRLPLPRSIDTESGCCLRHAPREKLNNRWTGQVTRCLEPTSSSSAGIVDIHHDLLEWPRRPIVNHSRPFPTLPDRHASASIHLSLRPGGVRPATLIPSYLLLRRKHRTCRHITARCDRTLIFYRANELSAFLTVFYRWKTWARLEPI